MEPQNPTVPTVPTPPPQVTPPAISPVFPKKNNLAVILLSISLLITLLISGYLFLQVQKLNKELADLQVQPTPTPLSTEIPSPTTDPTIDWKTYTNTDLGFNIKYPVAWKYKEQIQSVSFTGTEGEIYIVWGDGFGGGYCTDPDNQGLKIEPYSLVQQGLMGCTSIDPKGKKSWFLSKEIHTGLSVKIQGNINTLSTGDSKLIDQILSTFKFTD